MSLVGNIEQLLFDPAEEIILAAAVIQPLVLIHFIICHADDLFERQPWGADGRAD